MKRKMNVVYLFCFICLLIAVDCLPHRGRHSSKKQKQTSKSGITRGVKRQFDIQCSDTKCCWVHATGHDSHDHNCGLNLHPIRHHYPLHEDPCNHGDTCGRQIRHCGICRCHAPHMHHGYNRCGRCLCGDVRPLHARDASSCNCAYDTHSNSDAIGTGAVNVLQCNYEDDDHPCTRGVAHAMRHPHAHHVVVPHKLTHTTCRLWKDDECMERAKEFVEMPLAEQPKPDPVHVYSSLVNSDSDGALHASVPSGSKDVPVATMLNHVPLNGDGSDTPAVKTANVMSNPTPVLTAKEETYEQIPIAATHNDVYPISAREEPTDVEIEPTDADIMPPEQKSSTYSETTDDSLVDHNNGVVTTTAVQNGGAAAVTKNGAIALQKNITGVNTPSDVGVLQQTSGVTAPVPVQVTGGSVNMAAPIQGSNTAGPLLDINTAGLLHGSNTAGPLHGNIDLLEHGNVMNSVNAEIQAANSNNNAHNKILANDTQNELLAELNAQPQRGINSVHTQAVEGTTQGGLVTNNNQAMVVGGGTVQQRKSARLLKFIPADSSNKVVTITAKANGLPLVNPNPLLSTSSQSKSIPPSRVTLNDRTDPRVNAVSNELTHETDDVIDSSPESAHAQHLTTNVLPVVGKIESKANDDDDVNVDVPTTDAKVTSELTKTSSPVKSATNTVASDLKIPTDADVSPELLKSAPNAAAAIPTGASKLRPETISTRLTNPSVEKNIDSQHPTVVRRPTLGAVVNNAQVTKNQTLDVNSPSKEKFVV